MDISKIKKLKIPVQAVCNMLNIFSVPEVLFNLSRLETVLISRRILFKITNIMPKGRFPKSKGSICNIPIDSNDIKVSCHEVLTEMDFYLQNLNEVEVGFRRHV